MIVFARQPGRYEYLYRFHCTLCNYKWSALVFVADTRDTYSLRRNGEWRRRAGRDNNNYCENCAKMNFLRRCATLSYGFSGRAKPAGLCLLVWFVLIIFISLLLERDSGYAPAGVSVSSVNSKTLSRQIVDGAKVYNINADPIHFMLIVFYIVPFHSGDFLLFFLIQVVSTILVRFAPLYCTSFQSERSCRLINLIVDHFLNTPRMPSLCILIRDM